MVILLFPKAPFCCVLKSRTSSRKLVTRRCSTLFQIVIRRLSRIEAVKTDKDKGEDFPVYVVKTLGRGRGGG
jgi:hypothetical protein